MSQTLLSSFFMQEESFRIVSASLFLLVSFCLMIFLISSLHKPTCTKPVSKPLTPLPKDC
ncbi:hypothetical protein NX86_04240 [Streptococcus phocae subsp. salmonis]|nr:hypothetical protein NX86_04240 [Streptococcus phocae subsp. salmonis]